MLMEVPVQGRPSAVLRLPLLSTGVSTRPVLLLKSTFNIVELMDEKSIPMRVMQTIGFRHLPHIPENLLRHFPNI
jgi:hypothetical protein